MERKEWVLLVIDTASPGSVSPVQLQKILFLMSKQLPDQIGRDFYHFVPYNYGPFDSDIYSDVRLLLGEGLVQKVEYADKGWVAYEITPQGQKAAEQLRSQVNDRTSQYVANVTRWVTSLTFTQLLSAIYKAYPEYKANSVFA